MPILQIINLLFGIFCTAFEWPAPFVQGYAFHRSFEFRFLLYPMSALFAALIYQGTNPAIYYLIAIVLYFWAYADGEVALPVPCSRPRH